MNPKYRGMVIFAHRLEFRNAVVENEVTSDTLSHSGTIASPSHKIMTSLGEDIFRNREVSTPQRCNIQHAATYTVIGERLVATAVCASHRDRFWLGEWILDNVARRIGIVCEYNRNTEDDMSDVHPSRKAFQEKL